MDNFYRKYSTENNMVFNLIANLQIKNSELRYIACDYEI